METQLEVIVKSSGLEVEESKNIISMFGNYESMAKDWELKAKEIVVTDASQTTEMAMAKVARKKFSDLRIDVEKARKNMKEQSLRKGQAIDAVARFLVSLISPIEEHLRLQEDFIKIQDAKKAEELRLIEEKRLEDERIEKEKTEAQERERIRIENEKMRKELEEKEKARLELEEKTRKEKEEADKKLAEERAAAQKILDDQKAEAEKARVEAQRILDDEKKKADDARLLAEKEKKELEDKIASMIECPNCHHKFNI